MNPMLDSAGIIPQEVCIEDDFQSLRRQYPAHDAASFASYVCTYSFYEKVFPLIGPAPSQLLNWFLPRVHPIEVQHFAHQEYPLNHFRPMVQ